MTAVVVAAPPPPPDKRTEGRTDGLHVDSGSNPKPGHLAAFHGAGTMRRPAAFRGTRIERIRPSIKKLKRGSLARFSLMCPCVGWAAASPGRSVGRPLHCPDASSTAQSGGGRNDGTSVSDTAQPRESEPRTTDYASSSSRTLQNGGPKVTCGEK